MRHLSLQTSRSTLVSSRDLQSECSRASSDAVSVSVMAYGISNIDAHDVTCMMLCRKISSCIRALTGLKRIVEQGDNV